MLIYLPDDQLSSLAQGDIVCIYKNELQIIPRARIFRPQGNSKQMISLKLRAEKFSGVPLFQTEDGNQWQPERVAKDLNLNQKLRELDYSTPERHVYEVI
ncbi:MAG: hypothetical protein WCV59_00575 [Parcubacteria group bacterium]|jgi:hypothetical protein